jgi:5-methylcytosine-specific restriction protein A
MRKLSEIAPHGKPRVMDLVSSVGVDVSEWKNFRKGKKYAAANPKYCYEWSFVVPEKVVVLNLWHDRMKEKNKQIVWSGNLREWASQVSGPEKRRSQKMDEAIQTAVRDKLPIRVIVGTRKNNLAIVSKRCLDLVSWTVIAYDEKTGQCTLSRGSRKHQKKGNENAADDLSDIPEGNPFPDRAKTISEYIERDARVRKYVLKRANGKCEYCGERGFPTANGGLYVETHHIISLCDSGRDTVDNVIALCPQHHRRAHYGADAESLEAQFVSILNGLDKRTTS